VDLGSHKRLIRTPSNNKVAACARFARSGEHGAERRAGNFWTLSDSRISSEKGPFLAKQNNQGIL